MDQDMLQTVLDLSRRMAETRTLSPLLDYAMGEAIRLVGAERGYLVLINADESLDFRVVHAPPGEMAANAVDQISRTILNAVVSTGSPLVVRDAGLDPTFSTARSVMLLKLRSVMCVPLIARGQVLGAIYVENRSAEGRFSEEDLTPLSLFANQAAIAIENAQLNEELEARIAERTRELEEAKTAIEKNWHEAVEANRLGTVWLGNVAHDMRAPLTIVLSSLELLKEGAFGDLTQRQIEWVKRAYDAAGRALKLTNDVFDLSKLEMGGLRLYPEPVAVDAFLRDVYDTGRGLPWPPGVDFYLRLPESLPTLTMDPARIQQILMNLLANAIRFTDQGSVTLYAEYQADSAEVLIGVHDTGTGIAQEDVGNLFKRFVQATPPKDKRRRGTGLGLAISKELVEMHGGRLGVDTKLGVGSDFHFALPVQDGHVGA
ncbi:MAG: GAF domain-containing protein [Anaerolineae bacterium]|nr:GAF domain-containing protein [Anaerolineae bacterium]